MYDKKQNKEFSPMKKVMQIFLIIILVGTFSIAMLWLQTYIADYSVMMQDIESIEELKTFFEEKDVLIPNYASGSNNPYLHLASEDFGLERSKQKGAWDGYDIIIRPLKISKSEFFSIAISASKATENVDQQLKWTVNDVTTSYTSSENYPKGAYTHIMGEFQKGETIYQFSGDIFGKFDEARESVAKNELMYLIDSLRLPQSQ
jgi:hypothetical protein